VPIFRPPFSPPHSIPHQLLSLPPFFFPAAASNFVDGDLIERFLDLPHGKMLEIASGFQRADDQGVLRDLSVHDIVQAVEEMTRLH
jgi:hypothetical protein